MEFDQKDSQISQDNASLITLPLYINLYINLYITLYIRNNEDKLLSRMNTEFFLGRRERSGEHVEDCKGGN